MWGKLTNFLFADEKTIKKIALDGVKWMKIDRRLYSLPARIFLEDIWRGLDDQVYYDGSSCGGKIIDKDNNKFLFKEG